tara:strand:+ start:217 stop:387 length:171 start_codon:yes stop_codon:yes gene_type:complete
MKDLSKIQKVDSPQKKIKSISTTPELVRRTMGGKIKVIKARGAGAATRGFNFHEKV